MIGCNFAEIDCVGFPSRARTGEPIAIVIHYLADDYTTVRDSQIVQTVQTANFDTAIGYHYLISDLGISTRLANPTLWIPNLHEYTSPTWSEIPDEGDPGHDNPDEVVIHIALTNISLPCNSYTDAQALELVRLLCCLKQAFNSTIDLDADHIFLPPILDVNQTDYYDGSELEDSIIADAIECINTGNVGSLLDQIINPNCCDDNETAIAALDTRIDTLETTATTLTAAVAALDARLDIVEAWQATNQDMIDLLSTQYPGITEELQSIREFLATVKTCIDEVCPNNSYCGIIQYSLTQVGNFQRIFSNINKIVNFAEKIVDLNPAAVRIGPLWRVNLLAGTYQFVVSARLSEAEYAEGDKVWLNLVSCGVRTKIAEITLEAGSDTVEISTTNNLFDNWDNNVVFSAPCSDTHIEIGTDSEVTPGYKTLEYANIVITPVF